MAIDSRKRQQQLAKKAAKRKQELRKRAPSVFKPIKDAFRFLQGMNAPIYECLLPRSLPEVGLGNVLVSRKSGSQVFYAVFLVDIYCLGIKDANYSIASYNEYCFARDHLYSDMPSESFHPTCARKLVEGAVAYARNLGFSTHPDYKVAKEIFGDIDAGACPTAYEFGKDGKPFFVSGPYDTPRRCREIIETLRKSCGENSFDYMLGIDAFPD